MTMRSADRGAPTGDSEPFASCDLPRLATLADLPAIKRVVGAAYATYAERMDQPPAPVLHDYAAEVGAGAIWVIGHPVAGLIVLIGDGDSLLVENVAVDPPAQGRGLGRRLMEFAEQRAAGSGLRRVSLYTNEIMVENISIYGRLGYREVARRTEHGYRRVFMEKELLA